MNFKAENVVWVGEPSIPFNEKQQRWNQYTTWNYKTRDYEGILCMSIEEHEVYLAEKALFKIFSFSFEKRHCSDRKLIDLIITYGEKVAEKAANDVYDDFASREASY